MSQHTFQPQRRREMQLARQAATLESLHLDIRNAWIAAVLYGGLQFLLGIVLIAKHPTLAASEGAPQFLGAALTFAFAYGIARLSRTCAILVLASFVANAAVGFVSTGSVPGLALGLLLMFYLARGVIGTYRYHSYRRKARA